MINKTTDKFYLVARIIFGLLAAIYCLWLFEAILFTTKYYFDFLPHLPLVPSLILFIFAIFRVNKYPKAIGWILLALGVISTVLLFRFPVFDDFVTTSDYGANLVCCIPTYLLMFILGFILLLRGNADEAKQKSELANQP